jgi:hypothetical protein
MYTHSCTVYVYVYMNDIYMHTLVPVYMYVYMNDIYIHTLVH